MDLYELVMLAAVVVLCVIFWRTARIERMLLALADELERDIKHMKRTVDHIESDVTALRLPAHPDY